MSLSTLCTHSPHKYQQIEVPRTGQRFFSSLPDVVFNFLSSFTDLEEFGRLHCVIQSNKKCDAHCERIWREDASNAELVCNVFTSIEVLSLFVGS